MIEKPTVTLELDDIQAPLLYPRPTKYASKLILYVSTTGATVGSCCAASYHLSPSLLAHRIWHVRPGLP